jgi:hypothetical protein
MAKKKRGKRRRIPPAHHVPPPPVPSPSRAVRAAREYPIEGCWTFDDWDEGGMTVVAVARCQPQGLILVGTYVVDYYCLGVKDATFRANIPQEDFFREVLDTMLLHHPYIQISTELAHELIWGAVEYAEQFGFRPHRDFRQASLVLDPPDAHPRTGQVEFGHKGKPFYIQGPYDNTERILRQLNETAGEGNYNFTIGVPLPDWDE